MSIPFLLLSLLLILPQLHCATIKSPTFNYFRLIDFINNSE